MATTAVTLVRERRASFSYPTRGKIERARRSSLPTVIDMSEAASETAAPRTTLKLDRAGGLVPSVPDELVTAGQLLAPRVALFGFPFVIALMLAVQQVPRCDGPGTRDGASMHTVVSLLATSSVSLAAVGLWAAYRTARPAPPEVCSIERTPWTPTTGWLESVDLVVGVVLAYSNLIMVLQLIEAVLIRDGLPAYVTVVTAVVCCAGFVGMWTDELARLLAGEPADCAMLVPQLVPVRNGVVDILSARRTGHFDRMSCDEAGGRQCRARLMLAFVAFVTSSWAVVANLHQELRCDDAVGNPWSTDGASDVLDLVLLEISGFACFTCDWRAGRDTLGRMVVGVLLVGALYGLSCAWLQSRIG